MSDVLREKQADTEKLRTVMQSAAQAAIAEHHRRGLAVPIWRDGRVVWLGPGGVIHETNPNGSLATNNGPPRSPLGRG